MTKKELEVYAALVLVKTSQISEPFSTDWLKDRPDIQIGKLGIEGRQRDRNTVLFHHKILVLRFLRAPTNVSITHF